MASALISGCMRIFKRSDLDTVKDPVVVSHSELVDTLSKHVWDGRAQGFVVGIVMFGFLYMYPKHYVLVTIGWTALSTVLILAWDRRRLNKLG